MIKPFQGADSLRSTWQLVNSLTLYVLFWVLGYAAFKLSPWLVIPVALIAQLAYVRIFIIFHDCGHGSFYRQKKWRTFWGYLTGILTFTPYHQWTTEHATHHKHSGNLDTRGRGDIWTMTVEEYGKASTFQKILYRIYRFPPFMLLGGGFLIFVLMYRFTTKHDGAKERRSVHITNLGILSMAVVISLLTSFQFYLLFQLTVVVFAGLFGIGLFYVQHQFDGVYWRNSEEWDYEQAALEGCSYLKLPKLLQWGSGNIGFHHIHHLSALIPNYRLEEVYNKFEIFQKDEVVLTMKDLVRCFQLNLYDAKTKKMIRFRDLKNPAWLAHRRRVMAAA